MAKYIVLYDDGETDVVTADNPQALAIELFNAGSDAVIYEYADGLTYNREHGRFVDEDDNYYDINTHSLYSISSSRGVYDEQKQELILDVDDEE